MKFVDDNPQFCSRTRTGTRVDACSYAYPEVQDFIINRFENIVKYGFDGISLIFHRVLNFNGSDVSQLNPNWRG